MEHDIVFKEENQVAAYGAMRIGPINCSLSHTLHLVGYYLGLLSLLFHLQILILHVGSLMDDGLLSVHKAVTIS